MHLRPIEHRGIEILQIAREGRLFEMRRSGEGEWRRIFCQTGYWSVAFLDLSPLPVDTVDQSKTASAVDVPIVEPLREALDAGPLGAKTLLESNRDVPFTPKGFYGLIKKACVKAGIPHCSPHGLRKSAAQRCREAGCTDDEGMAITGHKAVKEYRRYAGDIGKGQRADAGMKKVMANQAKKLATEQP